MKPEESLYVTDLDGTLLKDDQTLSKETISFLTNAIENGLNFTYATARSIASSAFVLESLQLKLPVILYNGAQIYCPKKQSYIHTAYMDSDSYLMQLQSLLNDGLDPIVHCLDENDNLNVYFKSVANESTKQWINSRLKNGDKRFRVTHDFSEIDSYKVIELMVVGYYEQLVEYKTALEQDSSISFVLGEDVYCRGYYWLELSHANANKGFAVEKLRKYLFKEGIVLKNIISFGDNHNDIPMFKQSTKSCAVNNAKASIKDIADSVIKSNNEDAVIGYLKENVMAN